MESVITLNEAIDTAAFYGVNNANILCLCNQHPGVRVVARGYKLKVIGSEEAIKRFQTVVERCEQACRPCRHPWRVPRGSPSSP